MRFGFHFGRPALYGGALVAAAGILAGGIALKPAIAQVLPLVVVTCGGVSPCQTYKNTGTGAGLEGLTGKGIGLFGSATKGGTGVKATSVTGLGVFATSTSSLSGLFEGAGLETIGSTFGLFSDGPTGVEAVSDSASGDVIEAFSDGGLLFHGISSGSSTVFTVANSGAISTSSSITAGGSVVSPFIDGTGGVFGFSSSGDAIEAENSSSNFAFFANGFGGDLFVGNNSGGTNSFVVDNSGNIIITGNIFTSGFCSSGCAQRPGDTGPRIVSYSPHESQPTMEDFGEAQLSGGQGYVRLEATFAKTIDQHANYMVFITPEGDSNGLYVTQKTGTGFAVRESRGGHSTLAFSYRIVAKPYGDTSARLPMTRPTTISMGQKHHTVTPALPALPHGHVARPIMPQIPHN